MDLQELNEELQHAQEHAIEREESLYEQLLLNLGSFLPHLKQVAEALATLDVIQGFAWLALQRNYCRPEIGSALILKGARHPTVENFIGPRNFVPNDIFLDEKQKQMLITGPNMAGKSTIMRTITLFAILNQSGSYVPADSAQLPIFDHIFTRIGASDDLAKGLSTFMVEMTETAHILRQATRNSLVILDEVGRGTSTADGVAIASAVLEYLAQRTQCWSFFATHYHELVPFAKNFEIVRIFQTEVINRNTGIAFTHRLVEGSCGNSYGIEVAKLAGIPDKVIGRAGELLSEAGQAPSSEAPTVIRLEKEHFRQEHRKIIEEIEKMSINRTSPIQALNMLHHLKEMLTEKAKKDLFQDRHSLF